MTAAKTLPTAPIDRANDRSFAERPRNWGTFCAVKSGDSIIILRRCYGESDLIYLHEAHYRSSLGLGYTP